MKYLLLLISALILNSCAEFVKPKQTIFNNSVVINKSYDQVWSSAISFASQNNYPMKNIEKSSGLLCTEVIDIQDSINVDYCDCGTAKMSQNTVYYNAKKFNLTFNFEKISERETKVTIYTFWGCNYPDMFVFKGYSRGYLESEIFNYLKN